MARRVSLPAADELFRPTAPAEEPVVRAVPDVPEETEHAKEVEAASTRKAAPAKPAAKKSVSRRTSGRVRHDEKMTVYVTSDELLDLEHARLMLRRNHGLAVDRGRLVREAVALVLAEFEELGEESALVKRLIEE